MPAGRVSTRLLVLSGALAFCAPATALANGPTNNRPPKGGASSKSKQPVAIAAPRSAPAPSSPKPDVGAIASPTSRSATPAAAPATTPADPATAPEGATRAWLAAAKYGLSPARSIATSYTWEHFKQAKLRQDAAKRGPPPL